MQINSLKMRISDMEHEICGLKDENFMLNDDLRQSHARINVVENSNQCLENECKTNCQALAEREAEVTPAGATTLMSLHAVFVSSITFSVYIASKL